MIFSILSSSLLAGARETRNVQLALRYTFAQMRHLGIKLHLFTTSTKFLEANLGGYIPEALTAQTKSMSANHTTLATATAAANCSANFFSMISCHLPPPLQLGQIDLGTILDSLLERLGVLYQRAGLSATATANTVTWARSSTTLTSMPKMPISRSYFISGKSV